ncbi:MAG: DNA mismatch repair protein MutS [Rickettsiales bacterium]|jgi:DNA mismatch repair protein MutS|nr:DNA mismatch repair protein MutS [Rickettsiales bacterium]
MSDSAKLSPIMRQYLDMKDENPGAVLLFRLGDFYECFFGDAVRVSRALDLVLTHRGTDERGVDIPMCGMPWHASDNYIGRLVKQGIAVALAEQMETPDQARARGHKQIERKIVRVITAGTLTDDNLLAPKSSNYLAAVFGDDLAVCDISTGELILGRSDNIHDELARISPAEVIYSEAAAETPFIIKIRESFNTTPVSEKVYERAGRDPGAYSLLLAYLELTSRADKIILQTPKRLGAGRQLLIDSATWKSLEIDAPQISGGACLLDVLDQTATAPGARKLRGILRDLTGDIAELQRRQGHVGHFALNKDIFGETGALLEQVPDIGRSIARLGANRGLPRDLKAVANFIALLPAARTLGPKLVGDLAQQVSQIETHDNLGLELARAVNDGLPVFFRDGGVIRAGYSQALDAMNELSHDSKTVVAGLKADYVNATGITALKIKYNGILGYHIEVPAASGASMLNDANFIHRQTMAGNLRFTTARLAELDNEIRSAGERAATIEQEIIQGLIARVMDISESLHQTADLLAQIDVWRALAGVATGQNWVRPELTDGTEFCVVGGRHPVVEFIMRRAARNFVKNDCNLTDRRVALLTGPNMAGKSTYLRQNALIAVLAHLGSFVPAASAKIGIIDQLFSRVGASDNLAAGQSTFMVEMIETANILNRATDRSFIIFDEIGRGTATYDGMAIASAVLEFLDNLHPRTLFATHYHELTGMPFANVKNLTIAIEEHNDEIIFMHKIIDGVANRSYGIHVAKMAGMPASVVESAEKTLASLEQNRMIAAPAAPAPAPAPAPSVFILRDKKKQEPQQLSLF